MKLFGNNERMRWHADLELIDRLEALCDVAELFWKAGI
jgi:hypothetical protein